MIMTMLLNGTFDGAGHNVSGVYLDGGYMQGVGLFGRVESGGKVCNLGVTDSYFKGNSYWNGAVCGFINEGTIENCYADATVVGSNDGGVCGQNQGTVANCYSVGKVSGKSNVGGVCGDNEGEITNCYSVGKVSGDECVGGVCGYNEGEITNCYSVDKVSGEYHVGGICGENYGTLANCYYDSTVCGGSAIGYDDGNSVNVLGKTTAQFKSGEVCYLLNQNDGIENDVWGQNIGTDKAPVLGGEKVYKITYKNGDSEYEADYANAGEFELPVSSLKGFVAYSDNTDYLFAGQKVQIESDTSFNIVRLTINMMKGASMRMNEQTGIRFYSQIDTDLITALRNAARNAGATISLGTIISKKSIIGEQEFTKDISSQLVDIKYIDVKYEAETWYSEDEFTGMVGSILNIKESNYNEEFVGRGYVTVTYGDVSTTVYADYAGDSISNNSRSICYIANQIMKDQAEYETLSPEKQQIVKDFADKYTGEDKYNQ